MTNCITTEIWTEKPLSTSAAPGSPLVSLVNTIANTVQVDYLDSAGHIHQLSSANRTTWSDLDLTVAARAPAAAANSPLATEINTQANTVEIYFLGTDNHVRELWWNGAMEQQRSNRGYRCCERCQRQRSGEYDEHHHPHCAGELP